MSAPILVPYLHYEPRVGAGARFGRGAVVVGRAAVGAGTELGDLAVLRADGERIDIGADCRILARATVHISDGRLPARVGDRATVGRYALVHACDIGDDCVLADGAVVMDGSDVGAGVFVAAGALVPPGKILAGGVVHAGNPARPARDLRPGELAALRRAVREGRGGEHLDFAPPPPSMAPYRAGGRAGGPEVHSTAFVAPGAALRGPVRLAESASVWFAAAVCADGAEVEIGPRSNVQDNSILVATAADGPIVIGADATIGHNVRMGACRVGDGALVGMGAEMAPGVVVEDGAVVGARALVEPGTVVKAGHVWAGRPARAFRPVTAEERRFFARGCAVYVGYAARYLARAA